MSPNLKIPRLTVEIWLILAVIVAHGYAAAAPAGSLLNWFRSDDAFYYFKTAQNISEGYGITFDRLGRDGGFHPLWMAICVPIFALARLDLLLPLRIMVMVSALLNAASGILILRMARRVLPPAAAAFAGFFFCFYPPIHSSIFQMGLESGLSAFSLTLLLYSVMRAAEQPEPGASWLWKVGLCGALAVLARLDNIFVVAVLGAWLVLRPLHPLQSERGRALALLDAALVAVGVLASFMWRVGFGVTFEGYALSEYVLLALALAVRLAVYWALGLYPGLPGGMQIRLAGIARLLLAWALASALTGGLMLVLLSAGAVKAFPRLVLVYEAALALLSLAGSRTLWWGWDAFQARRGSTQQPASEGPASDRPSLLSTLRAWASRSLVLFAPTATALAVYITFYKLYFGTFSPVSGQIKRWWGTLPNTVYGRPTSSLAGLLGFAEKSGPWELAQNIILGPFKAVASTAGLALTILWAAAFVGLVAYLGYTQRARIAAALARLPVFPLGIGAFAQVISYTGTGYLHMRAWYWTAQMLFFTLLLAALFDAALTALKPRLRAQTAAAAACLALVIALGFNLYDNLPYPSGDMSGSLEDVRDYYGITELEQRTPPGALIGSTGGGGIAYLVHDRTIVNLDGLMNTAEYFQALQEGTAAQYLDRLGLDYVFTGEYVITDSDPYFQFKGRLEKIANFGGAALFRWLPACKEDQCEF